MLVFNLNQYSGYHPISKAIAKYTNYINTNHSSIFTKIYQYEIYGDQKNAEYHTNILSDLNGLVTYLIQIAAFILADTANSTTRSDYYYYETYHLECKARYFQCFGVNIFPILDLFKIPYPQAGELSTTGIGAGSVRGDSETADTDVHGRVD